MVDLTNLKRIYNFKKYYDSELINNFEITDDEFINYFESLEVYEYEYVEEIDNEQYDYYDNLENDDYHDFDYDYYEDGDENEKLNNVEILSDLMTEAIHTDDLEKFCNFIHDYNYIDYYKICIIDCETCFTSNKYVNTIVGIVVKSEAYNILLYLLDQDIDFTKNSYLNILSSEETHVNTPLYQILSAKDNKIEEHCLELCKKLLDRGVSLNEISDSYYFNDIQNGLSGIKICEYFHRDFLNILIEYEKNLIP